MSDQIDFQPISQPSGGGIDFQPLDQSASVPQEGSSQLDVAKSVMGQVSQLAPWNKANAVLKNDIGGGIATGAGYLGGKVANAGYPNTGNAIQIGGVGLAGAISLSPEILAAYTSWSGINSSRISQFS